MTASPPEGVLTDAGLAAAHLFLDILIAADIGDQGAAITQVLQRIETGRVLGLVEDDDGRTALEMRTLFDGAVVPMWVMAHTIIDLAGWSLDEVIGQVREYLELRRAT